MDGMDVKTIVFLCICGVVLSFMLRVDVSSDGGLRIILEITPMGIVDVGSVTI